MRTVPILTLIIGLYLFQNHLYAQSEFENFAPGSKSIGYGGSLVVQVRDPSAVFWNPAALSGLKDRELLLSVNQPFGFNFVSLTQFLPLYGTFGVALARIPVSTENVDRGSVAWGKEIVHGFSIGSNVNIEKLGYQWFGTAGISLFVGNPRLGTLDQSWKEASPSNILDRVNLGVTIRNIPLIDKLFEPAVLLGFSYVLPSSRLLLNSGYHILKGDNTSHLGVGLALFENLSIYSGVEDLDFDTWGLGVGYSLDNFMADLTYSKKLEGLLFTVSARISSQPTHLAAPYYQRATQQIKSGNYKSALHEFKKYLAFDLMDERTDTVRVAVHALEKKLAETQFLVDSLFALTEKILLQDETQKLRAALILIRILELDSSHLKARRMLANFRPYIDEFIRKSQIDGLRKFESKEYAASQEIFKRILLFNKNDEIALKYLSKIESLFSDLGQEHFYRGLGYYRQKNFDLAKAEFLKALDYIPNLEEALIYLKRIDQKFEENRKKVAELLLEAQAWENQGQYVEAAKKYLQILKLDDKNDRARDSLSRLRPKIERFVENKYQEALRFLQEENFNSAEEAFSVVLSIEPEHRDARKNLAKLRRLRNERAEEYFIEGESYFENGNWQRALDSYNEALKLKPNISKIIQKKKDTEAKLEIANLQEEAKSKFKNQQFIEAAKIYEEILQLEPNNELAEKGLADCKNKIQEKIDYYFSEGIKLYTLEKYENAIKMWDEALKLDPDHKRSAEYKQQALERIKALKALKSNE